MGRRKIGGSKTKGKPKREELTCWGISVVFICLFLGKSVLHIYKGKHSTQYVLAPKGTINTCSDILGMGRYCWTFLDQRSYFPESPWRALLPPTCK